MHQECDILFLPGLDGTGLLIDRLLPLLPSWLHPIVIAYPLDRMLGYMELRDLVLESIRPGRPFLLLAESFSGPVAALVGELNPPGLQGIILSATFVTNPLPRLVSALRPIIRSPFFALAPPKFLTRRWLTGEEADDALVGQVQHAIDIVSARVLAFRVRHLIAVDARPALRAARVPILSLRATNDRVITERCQEILRRTSDTMEQIIIEGPHLLLQGRPEESAYEITRFASEVLAVDPVPAAPQESPLPGR
jgi:pimeloyl-ACP methyl ester carboxylesterase